METFIKDNLYWLRASLCRCLAFRKGVDEKELLSRVLENAWRYRNSFDGKSFRSWITVIAHNCVKRIWRDKVRIRKGTGKLMFTDQLESLDSRTDHIPDVIDEDVYVRAISGGNKQIEAAFRMLARGYNTTDVRESLGDFAFRAVDRYRRKFRRQLDVYREALKAG